jgi:hypothetical protein
MQYQLLITHLTNDYVLTAPVDFDCCFENLKDINFKQLHLHLPLANIISSVDDSRIASMKVEDV